jgi:DNA-binding PadR family transcriptional regulator
MGIRRVTLQTVQVAKALLEASEPIWGLELVRKTGLLSGTIYPILDRLEEANWVVSEWETSNTRPGPRRRLYHLTAEGRLGTVSLISLTQVDPKKKQRHELARKFREA